MKKTKSKIRDLMPDNYGNILKERTGKTRVHIYSVVNNENTEAEIWPDVLSLAEETMNKRNAEKERMIKLLNAA